MIPIIGLLLCVACGLPPPAVNTNPSTTANKTQQPPSQASAPEQSVEASAAQDKSADNKMANKKEVLAEARALLEDIKAMESEGRNITRRAQAAHDDCMGEIKSRWQRVQALRKRVDALPKVLQLQLGAAGGELINCLSCGSDAVSFCDQTKHWIKGAEKTIAEYARGEI